MTTVQFNLSDTVIEANGWGGAKTRTHPLRSSAARLLPRSGHYHKTNRYECSVDHAREILARMTACPAYSLPEHADSRERQAVAGAVKRLKSAIAIATI